MQTILTGVLLVLSIIQLVVFGAVAYILYKYKQAIIEEWSRWQMFKADWQSKLELEATTPIAEGRKKAGEPIESGSTEGWMKY